MSVMVCEVNNPMAIKTDLLVDAGLTLCYRERDTYGQIYYIGNGMLVITEVPACCGDMKHFLIRNGEKCFLVESVNNPIIVSEGEGFINYLRSLKERTELWTTFGLWYVARFVFSGEERRKFEELMTKEPYSKLYVWYYYSAYIDKDVFVELVDKVKKTINHE
jgi:hypothetical protein